MLTRLDAEYAVAKGDFQQRFYVDEEFGNEMEPAEAFQAFMEQKYPQLWTDLLKFAKTKKREIVVPTPPVKPQPPLKMDGSIDETALDSEVAALMVNEKYEPDVAWERVCNKYGLEGSEVM